MKTSDHDAERRRTQMQRYKEIYRDNYDDVVNHTIRLQKHFSACIGIIYFIYSTAICISNYIIWDVWNPVILMGFAVAALSAVNWGFLQKGIFSKGNAAIVSGNIFLLTLLLLLVVVRSSSDGYVSNTLIVCTILATAVISFQPGWYAVIIFVATIGEMISSYIDYTAISLPFAAIVNFWIDALLIMVTAISINLIISMLRYNLLEEKHQLRRESIIDALTGLYTRKYFERFFQLHYREDELSAMFHMDLDNFKTLNDTMGHHQGDALLKKTAELLQQHFRKSDCVARVGGDEFMVFMPSLTDVKPVTEKIEHILQSFPIVIEDNENQVKVSVSIGVALSEQGKELTYQALYEMADEAMYHAKRSGKGRAALMCDDGRIKEL